ncbi:hypothetical protein AT15_04885 [Kosmotoga arenicorallina S304]|uniref:Positive regulator of sigma E, RseC/MucC n=1 Tax=Kosmotoga arenicorallina S304 TaxID=1453497 RepID=A0A176JWG5_9BACT|nr:SoxR reducing system RseC family protein [Kosmotoga arenicorallina]OAA28022.1 hypothetical protein AT15_04885 [Kosmotoga arenicorallina S304]
MKELALVKEIRKDYVLLSKNRTEACGSCALKDSCSTTGTVARKIEIRALKNNVNIAPGDYVEIEVPNFSVSKLAFLLYGIPLAVFIATLLFMIGLNFSELLSVLTAFGFMSLFYAGLALYDRRSRRKLMPIIIRKVSIKDVFKTNE